MIEILETPTFVVEDFYDVKDNKLFQYFDYEKIPYEVLELSSAEIENRGKVYFPVVVKDFDEDLNLFTLVNPYALKLAHEDKAIIVFIYAGHKNIAQAFEDTLLTQLLHHRLTLHDIRVVTSNKTLSVIAPYVYFSFDEMDAYIEAHSDDALYVDGFCETKREHVFSCNVPADTAHARLFCASIWYHALAEYSYMNYPTQSDKVNAIASPIYHWEKHWSATATLMDMFGQQLPVINEAGSKLDYYNNAYWNFAFMPSFSSAEVTLSKEVFKPILNLQPFVIVGPAGSIGLVKAMGYKTFSDQVNESYDRVTEDEARMQSLFRLVYEMAHFTGTELHDLNLRLRNILKHNQKHFLSSKRFKLLTLLNLLKARDY